MTIVYRTAWTDSTDDALQLLRTEFETWCVSKRIPAANVPERGTWEHDRRRITVQSARSNGARYLQCVLQELDPEGRVWTTTTNAAAEAGSSHYWVDLQCEDDSGKRFDPAAPRIVRGLIDNGADPNVAGLRLRTTARLTFPEAAAETIDLIADPRRLIPVICIAEDPALTVNQNITRNEAIAKATAGCAVTFFLPSATVDAYNLVVPRSHGVWNGAARVYLPKVVFADEDDGRRHRFFQAGTMRPAQRAASLVSFHIASSVPPVALPDQWVAVTLARPDADELSRRVDQLRAGRRHVANTTAALGRERDELLELLALADADLANLRAQANKELDEIRAERDRAHDELIDTVAELEAVIGERDAHRRNVTDLARAAGHGVDHGVPTDLDDEPDGFHATELLPSVAVEHARRQCHNIVIPETAIQDVERLDQDLKARIWGSTSLLGFETLDRYAAERPTGGFYNWCRITGGWPLNKVAMVESETVRNSERMARCRDLPIASIIAPAGTIRMESHLKIQVGGGNNIPRIYFYDDTAGPTGKIHIGFFGPHDLMPNKSTN